MRIFRSLIAVFAGYAVFVFGALALFMFSGRDSHADQPPWFMIVATIAGVLFALLGGIVAARITASRAALHASIVAVILALGAIVSLLTSPAKDATWSQWTALVFMAPAAWFGGRLVEKSSRNKTGRLP